MKIESKGLDLFSPTLGSAVLNLQKATNMGPPVAPAPSTSGIFDFSSIPAGLSKVEQDRLAYAARYALAILNAVEWRENREWQALLANLHSLATQERAAPIQQSYLVADHHTSAALKRVAFSTQRAINAIDSKSMSDLQRESQQHAKRQLSKLIETTESVDALISKSSTPAPRKLRLRP